jgi:tight adherence protein C
MNPTLLTLGAISALLVVLSAWGLLHEVQFEDRIGERLRGANTRVVREKASFASVLQSLAALVGRIGGAIARSGLLPRSTLRELQQTLATSGVSDRNGLGLFVGFKLMLMFVLPGSAMLLTHGFNMDADTANTVALIAGIAGLLGPDTVVRRLRKRYVSNVESGIADMLDLLLICAQSGLSLQPALARVEVEIRGMYPQLAWELAQTSTELQIIADSRVALANLGARTGIESLRRLTGTLAQTLQYGTPLSEALRSLANEMRVETLNRFEEKAARLPILLTVPMIVFILPCVFIIVGGPAVIQLIHNFG